MASTLDLLPTILKLVGVEAKKGIALDGYDMGPILFEGKKVRTVMIDYEIYTDLGLCSYVCTCDEYERTKWTSPCTLYIGVNW